MKIEITDWRDKRVIWSGDAEDTKAALYEAFKSGANLTGANLTGANLTGANLAGANLTGADLTGADLAEANLTEANLTGANLTGANLTEANLYVADLTEAKMDDLTAAMTRIVPDEGDVIGWKKASGHIVKLLIPANAPRSNATGRKCRTEFATVLAIEGAHLVFSDYRDAPTISYIVGQTVHCDKWNPNRWVECGGGIHFFITREEAKAYP